MAESIFRKESMDKISSPEQLDDYIKVSNPGVWMILSCIIILLVGMCVWGIFGKLDTTVTVPAICDAEKSVCYVSQDDLSDIENGMTVVIAEKEYAVTAVGSEPIKVTDDFGDYALHIGDFQIGEWVYEIVIDAELSEGTYEAGAYEKAEYKTTDNKRIC